MQLANCQSHNAVRPRAPWHTAPSDYENTSTVNSPAERPCLLIVESDAAMGKMLSSILESEYNVELARNEVLAHDCMQRRAIALVILDIHFFSTTWLSLIHALREDARTRQIPVVVLTASEHPETMLQCLAVGANYFLLKPFGMSDLRACVHTQLDLTDHSSHKRV